MYFFPEPQAHGWFRRCFPAADAVALASSMEALTIANCRGIERGYNEGVGEWGGANATQTPESKNIDVKSVDKGWLGQKE